MKTEDVEKELERLVSSCEKAAGAVLGKKDKNLQGNQKEKEELAQSIRKVLHKSIPRAAAFASKSGGLPNPLTYLHELVSEEDFTGWSEEAGTKIDMDIDTDTDTGAASSGETKTGRERMLKRKVRSLRSPAWQSVSTYNLCLEACLEEHLLEAAGQRDLPSKAEYSGREAAAAVEEEEEETGTGMGLGIGREGQAAAMLELFKRDLETCMEEESQEEADPDRAQMLMLGLMRGFDMLSKLEKEVVVEAIAP